MATLSLDLQQSRQSPPVAFHWDLVSGVSVGGFAIAMLVCLQHGDIAAIPALLCLAVMAFVVLSVHTPPETGSSTGPRRDGVNRITRTTFQRTHLWRRHSLGQ